MYQGSRRKAVVEGAIPAKGNAFGEAGGFGLGDSRGQQDASGARDLGELYPRFRDPSKQPAIAPAPAGGHPAGHPPLTKAAAQGRAEARAPKLSAPARNIAAMLTTEHAAEDDEVAAGQRLAARFVRRPEDETRAPSGKSVAPYIAAAAFVLLAAGGAAAYFVMSEGTSAQAGTGYVAASFAAPNEAGSGVYPGQATLGMMPQKPGGAQGAGSESWAEAVETFRALAGSAGAGAPQEKADEPKLEQLATGFNTTTTSEK
jgi:hypothetical protein